MSCLDYRNGCFKELQLMFVFVHLLGIEKESAFIQIMEQTMSLQNVSNIIEQLTL